jgi:hypothetical protein
MTFAHRAGFLSGEDLQGKTQETLAMATVAASKHLTRRVEGRGGGVPGIAGVRGEASIVNQVNPNAWPCGARGR